MKYIDAEKLIAEVERFSATEYGGNTLGDDVAKGALDYVLEEIIPSLQQEKPEADIEKEIDELWKSLNTGHDYVFVDSYQDFLGICLHCFELGLNARK